MTRRSRIAGASTTSSPQSPNWSTERRHALVFLIEFDNPITNDEEAPWSTDSMPRAEQNVEYETKRKSLRYGPPVIRMVRSGEYDRYRRRKVEEGRSDGQFKILRLTSDISFAAEFDWEGELVGERG